MSEESSTYKVLIIDDDLSFQKVLQIRLKSFMPGISVTSFQCLGDARTFLQNNDASQFDLAILDEHLPDGRGVEFLKEGLFGDLAVLCMSSDTCPEIPGAALKAGAAYFLAKVQASEPLFKPLVLGVIDSNRLRRQLQEIKLKSAVMESVKTLVNTLRHEINNPLGAVLGAAYLLRNIDSASEDQKKAAELVETSGKRIKHVLDQLIEAISVEAVTKAKQKVFHIPGDKPWEP